MVRTTNEKPAISMVEFQSFEGRGPKEESGRHRRDEDRTQLFTNALPWTGWTFVFLLFCSSYYWYTDFLALLSTPRALQQTSSKTRFKSTIRQPKAFAQVDLTNLQDARFSKVGTISRRTVFHVNYTVRSYISLSLRIVYINVGNAAEFSHLPVRASGSWYRALRNDVSTTPFHIISGNGRVFLHLHISTRPFYSPSQSVQGYKVAGQETEPRGDRGPCP